jgi:arginine deiminase-like protein
MLNIIDRDLAVIYPTQLPWRIYELLKARGFRFIDVPDAGEARHGMSLNMVPLAPGVVVMPAGNPITRAALEGAGVTVLEAEVDELMKGAGSVHCMTGVIHRDRSVEAGSGIAARFTWHPEYAGRLVLDVRQELVSEIEADQRAYELAMEAAEAKEEDALATVLRLEKRWSPFDLNWAESDPGELADRILAWEWEREKRHELFPYAEMREAAPPPAPIPPAQQSWLDWLKRLFGRDT